MTKKELIEILQKSLESPLSKDDDRVVIEIHQHGSIGSTPSVDVRRVDIGFDWNSGKIIIRPEITLKKADFDYEAQIKILTKEIGKLKLSKNAPAPVAMPVKKTVRKQKLMILTESVVPSEVFLAHASFSTGEVFQSLLWGLDDVEQFISSCVEGFDVEIDLSIYEPLELNKSIVKEYSYGDFRVTVSVSVTNLFGF